ncbi:3-dehydrosphinganine reductase [Angomonas deanei]|nr:3-dehydrosphinganine reductase [Angomonas deanei]|eukprot:EPY40269.1 3-dehydrosphinganine reductase [Angomonas deanei]
MDSSLADAKRMMNVNYFGCLNLMWALMPGMIEQKRGRVVLTSSLVARAPIAGYTLYSATKAGLRAFAHSTDMENSCLGVRVQVVSPPDVETPGFEEENKVKSPECAAISAFGGSKPFSAEAMGKAVVQGIEHYKFDITLGSDGWFVSHGSAGLEPATSVVDLLTECLLSGPLRLGLAAMSAIHYNIVKRVRCKK